MVTKDIAPRGPLFRSLRAVFRLIASDSLLASQRDFRNKVSTNGIGYALRLKADAYLGKYRCSVCGCRVRTFLPLSAEFLEEQIKYGFPYLPADAEMCNGANYSCPHCEASDRDRLFALCLSEYFQKLTPDDLIKIVDFAPAFGLSSFIRRIIARAPCPVIYRTADLLRSDVDDIVDITDMKLYRDDSVDFFICSHVLEHVDNDRRALAELYRILRPGAQGILVVPILLNGDEMDEDPSVTDLAERWRRFGQPDHVRRYSKAEFLSRTQQAGFTIHQLGVEHFGKETFAENCITDQSILYIVEKREQ